MITILSLAGFYIILVRPVSTLVRKGRLGVNKDLTKATFPQPQFFLEKAVVLLGASLYLTIISGLLGVFSCQYISNEWVVTRNQSLECYSGIYWLYFFLALMAFLIYYPAATLMFPNMMFQNKNLDLKYDTSFLVFESQGKLLIAGASAFFVREHYIWLHLLVVIVVCGGLSMYAHIKRPCLVLSYNFWKVCGYFVPIWVSLCALLNYYSDYKNAAFRLLIGGVSTIFMTCVGLKLVLVRRSKKNIN